MQAMSAVGIRSIMVGQTILMKNLLMDMAVYLEGIKC